MGDGADLSDEQRLQLIDAAIYGDLFDCAVTAEELWRFSRMRASHEEMRPLIAHDGRLGRVLSGSDGLYCIRGREELLAVRPPRRERASRLRRRARRVGRLLRHAPFVRGTLLTGSAAADDAPDGADVDLLVLVEPGRLATVFTLLGTLSRLLGRRVLCPNHYVALDALTVGRRDIYVARELLQAEPLCGGGPALLAANGWTAGLLPNATSGGGAPRSVSPTPVQRPAEAALGGRLGAAIERRLHRLARSRLARHHGGEPPAEVLADLDAGRQLRFHGLHDADDVLRRYRQRRAELTESLAERRAPSARAAP